MPGAVVGGNEANGMFVGLMGLWTRWKEKSMGAGGKPSLRDGARAPSQGRATTCARAGAPSPPSGAGGLVSPPKKRESACTA